MQVDITGVINTKLEARRPDIDLRDTYYRIKLLGYFVVGNMDYIIASTMKILACGHICGGGYLMEGIYKEVQCCRCSGVLTRCPICRGLERK